MNSKEFAWFLAMLGLIALFIFSVGYVSGHSAGIKAKFAASENATLIEGLCVEVLNSDKINVK